MTFITKSTMNQVRNSSSIIPQFAKRIKHLGQIRKQLLSIAERDGTPAFIYDSGEVEANYHDFVGAFRRANVTVQPFYAMKSNPYSGILKTVTGLGGCLDASSVQELNWAMAARPEQVVFTGPGKTERDFAAILKYHKRVTVHLESIRELEQLAEMARLAGRKVRVAARIYTKQQSAWSKFGIRLEDLPAFIRKAAEFSHVTFAGIHFHISWNTNAQRYVKTLKELGKVLRDNLAPEEREQLQFIDIGGGFIGDCFEALYPWNRKQSIGFGYPPGFLNNLLSDQLPERYIPHPIEPFADTAKQIAAEWHRSILSQCPDIQMYAEPGRYLCHSSMHHLLRVVEDKPDRGAVILDGGNNMIGWEKQQWVDYTPIFNLSQWSTTREFPVILYGSLCTSNDIWGYYLYGKRVALGDVLVMPYQGAYTYTLAQNFIKEIPPVVTLER